ncbi:MAG: GTP cyclohydrolase I, partial [Bacteroidales bacterium]|nr:GTP cyclohydrolase I [Bacteroidales bacterium]
MIEFVEQGAIDLDSARYLKVEKYSEEATEGISSAISSILTHLGEDITRDGIKQTPMRVAKALQFCTHGYQTDPKKMLEGALFHEDYSQMVLVKDIELYSLCEHH